MDEHKAPLLSVYREIEAIKEAVALKTINACARWLHDRGHPDLAQAMQADMIDEDEGDALSR